MKKSLLLSVVAFAALSVSAHVVETPDASQQGVVTPAQNRICEYAIAADQNTPAVAKAATAAVGYVPQGGFYGGYTRDFYSGQAGTAPAYTNITFKNTSTGVDLSNTIWLNSNGVAMDTVTDFVNAYGVSAVGSGYYLPIAENNGLQFRPVAFVNSGNTYYVMYNTSGSTMGKNGNYGISAVPMGMCTAFRSGNFQAGNADYCDNYWGNKSGFTNSKVTGFGQVYPAPVQTMSVDTVRVMFFADGKVGDAMKLSVYYWDEANSTVGDLICESTGYLTEDCTTEPDDEGYVYASMVSFPVTSVDPILGFPVNYVPVEAGQKICYMVTDFGKVENFMPRVFGCLPDEAPLYGITGGVVKVEGKNTAGEDATAFKAAQVNFTNGYQTNAFTFILEADFPYIYEGGGFTGGVYGGEDIEVEIPVEGSDKAYFMWAGSEAAANIEVEYDDAVAAWTKPTLDIFTSSSSSKDYRLLELDVQALPSDVKGRIAEFTAKSGLATQKAIIKQGDLSGVTDAVVDANGVGAYVEGGDIVVTVANAGVAEVYTVAGQLVKSVDVVAGTTVINGADLAAGVYVVKVGKAAVKVVK